MPNEVKIPKFAYPFKRRSNTATKTKSTHELYEEILFKDYQGQYLFNSSGLFHGGVHLYEDRFPINDFDTDGIRAIADGKIIYYRIDEEFLENELDDGTILKYSSSFMLLEHEIEYPATNILKFYSLYMHMAPASEYEFIEHVLDGEPVYVRDIDGADMSIARGTKVTLGKSLKNREVGARLKDKNNRYELLSYGDNNLKPPANHGWNVHVTNLKKVVATTVKGSSTNKPNIRKGSKNDSPFVKLLSAGDSIEVNAFQTEQEKASKRYAVISVNGTAVPVTRPRTTISKGNLTDTITEPKINNPENGFVTKHMTSQRRAVLSTSGLGIEVKAGDVLGKIGCYNTKEWEDEMELITHVEAFTFHDDLEKFIEDATTEYTKSTTELSSTQKAAYDKVRPKENQIYISKEKPRYAKEQHSTHLYVKLKEADNLRQVGATRTILRGRKTNNGTLFKVKPLVSGAKRYEVISIEEGDDVLTTVENEKKWSVYEPNVEIIGTFIEIPNSSKDFYKSIIKPLKTLKKLKDKEGTTYVLLENQQGIDVYVKNSDIEETHGITFKAFTYMEGEGEKKVGIFDDISKYYSKREDEIPQQDKEKLNELFGKVLKHIKLDKDESEARKNMLEAGEFAALSKQNIERRRAMSHILIKHESEWKNEKEKFTPVLDYMKNHNQNDRKKMFEDRLEKLAFFPDVHIGEGKTPTFIHPIALVEGFVGNCNDKCIVKTINFKLSNGKYYKVSKEVMKFILSFEGFKEKPYVPGLDSGITIGYGYDLGQQSKSQIEKDLKDFYTTEEIVKFKSVSGLKRLDAKANLYKVINIRTSKDTAAELSVLTKKRYAQDTYNIYPEIIDLHPHCQGALLSIVYNRGNNLRDKEGYLTRSHMRDIQLYLENGELDKIAPKIDEMKELWENKRQDGLVTRREEEAKYFKKGLKCDCYE